MNTIRFWLALDDAARVDQLMTWAIWIGVALIVLFNVVYVLPPLLMEGFAWLRHALRIPPSRGHVRVSQLAARLRRHAPPPSPPDVIVAVSDRDRLNVIVRMSDFNQKARIH